MALKPEQTVSAQVLLRAASGKRPDRDSRITAENINDWLPSGEIALRVREAFRVLGFEVGDLVGNSFSITGPVHLFESVFKTRLRQLNSGGIQFSTTEQASNYELDSRKIPHDLREYVADVTFTPPPAFGPTDY
jgi:hypothetical protein